MLLLALQQNTNTSSMSTNDIILYIAIVLSVILIFISSKKGKKVYTKKQGQLAIDMENYINELNMAFDKYKMYFNEVHQMCMEENNRKALEYLEDCMKKFSLTFELTNTVVEAVQRDIVRNNCKKATREMQTLIKTFSVMEELMEQLDVAKSIIESDRENKKYGFVNNEEYKENAYYYFKSCTNKESLQKRYKLLVKAFHPDEQHGDEESFTKIHDEYTKRLEELS